MCVPLFFGFPARLGHHRALNRSPVLYSSFWLVMYFIHHSVYLNPNLLIHPTPHFQPFPFSVHKFVLYICVYFCFANKLICTVFLESIYMWYYTSLCVTEWSKSERSSVIFMRGRLCDRVDVKLFFQGALSIKTCGKEELEAGRAGRSLAALVPESSLLGRNPCSAHAQSQDAGHSREG